MQNAGNIFRIRNARAWNLRSAALIFNRPITYIACKIFNETLAAPTLKCDNVHMCGGTLLRSNLLVILTKFASIMRDTIKTYKQIHPLTKTDYFRNENNFSLCVHRRFVQHLVYCLLFSFGCICSVILALFHFHFLSRSLSLSRSLYFTRST